MLDNAGMGEYRQNSHSVWEVKYHVIWVTKYRYKVLGGRDCGADAGPVAADMPGTGCGDRAGGSESGPRAHAGERAATVGTGEAGAVHERAIEPDAAGGISPVEETVLGGSICGREGISVRAWARWMRRRYGGISKISSGRIRERTSRLQRPPSLEPALSREGLKRLQPQTGDFQSQLKPTGFQPVVI